MTSNTRCFGDVNERIDSGINAFNVLGCADDTSLGNGVWSIPRPHVTRRRPEYTYLTTQWQTHGRLA